MSNTAEQLEQLGLAVRLPKISDIRYSGEHRND